MPSHLLDTLNGRANAPAQSAAPNGGFLSADFLSALMQFKNQFAPLLTAQNPAQAVQGILAQRGVSPAQFQQIVNQYSQQATEIRKQLMGR